MWRQLCHLFLSLFARFAPVVRCALGSCMSNTFDGWRCNGYAAVKREEAGALSDERVSLRVDPRKLSDPRAVLPCACIAAANRQN